MRKEIVWAIIGGIFFGLIVAFGIWRINYSKTEKPKAIINPSETPKSVSESKLQISIDKPKNESVVTESLLTLSGISKPNTYIVISTNEADYLTKTDQAGVFLTDIELVSGINQIVLTALDEFGMGDKTSLTIIYSPAFIMKENIEEASVSGSTIRDKVQAKVNELLYSPKAYLGIVTDITDSTVQLRTTTGEIKQTSVAEDEIVVTKDSGTKVTSVKFADVAIGDFIVAMGYLPAQAGINSNSVLAAQRILITPQIEELKIDISYGQAVDLLTSPKPTAKTSIFSFENGNVTKIKLADIEDEQNVIYVNSRTIFALTQN